MAPPSPPSDSLADAGQRVADEHVDDAGAAEGGREQHEAGRVVPDRADDGGAGAERVRRAARPAPRRPRSPSTTPPAGPRRPRTAGRCRGSRRRRSPRAAPGPRPRRATTATPAAVAISLRTVATPPRVASRMAAHAAATASSSAATRPCSGAVSDATSASMSSSPRASMMVMPWSPIGPETMHRVAGPRARRPRELDARSIDADAGGVDVAAVGLAPLHHLGVAGDDLHAGRRGRRAPSRRRSAAGRRPGSPPRG